MSINCFVLQDVNATTDPRKEVRQMGRDEILVWIGQAIVKAENQKQDPERDFRLAVLYTARLLVETKKD